MSGHQFINTKERLVYSVFHEDGFLDIIAGLIAMGVSFSIASDKVIFWLIFYIFGIGIWRASKQWIPESRTTNTKTSEKRNSHDIILIGMIIANLFLLCVIALILLNLKGIAA
jgi:hypothetical protein